MAQHMLRSIEKRHKGIGFGDDMWGDFFPYLQILFLFTQKFLDGVLSSVKNACGDTVRCPETSCQRLVVHEADKSVMEVGEIARKCEELLIGERLEIALGLLKQK